MTFEQALKKFMDAIKEGLEGAASDPEAVTRALRGVNIAGIITDALDRSGLKLAQVTKGTTADGEVRS